MSRRSARLAAVRGEDTAAAAGCEADTEQGPQTLLSTSEETVELHSDSPDVEPQQKRRRLVVCDDEDDPDDSDFDTPSTMNESTTVSPSFDVEDDDVEEDEDDDEDEDEDDDDDDDEDEMASFIVDDDDDDDPTLPLRERSAVLGPYLQLLLGIADHRAARHENHVDDDDGGDLDVSSSGHGVLLSHLRRRTDLSKEERKECIELVKSLKDCMNPTDPVKLIRLPVPNTIKSILLSKWEEFEQMEPSNHEYGKLKQYMDGICRVPFGKVQPLPVTNRDPPEAIRGYLKSVTETLHECIFGQDRVKMDLVQWVAKRICNPDGRGRCLALQGPMGVGKTTLARALSKALSLPMISINLGGEHDGSVLDGHLYCYEGSTWGRLAGGLMEAGCENPIFFFDELDKVSGRWGGGSELTGQLIHLTDFSQNHDMKDKYFSGIPFDLSRCLFVFSFNDDKKIDPILLNRLTVVKVPGYSVAEKKHILMTHSLPKILADMGRQVGDVTFTDDALTSFFGRHVAHEEGMRNAQSALQQLCGFLLLSSMMPAQLHELCTPQPVDSGVVVESAENIRLRERVQALPEVQFPLLITTPLLDRFMALVDQSSLHDHSFVHTMYM